MNRSIDLFIDGSLLQPDELRHVVRTDAPSRNDILPKCLIVETKLVHGMALTLEVDEGSTPDGEVLQYRKVEIAILHAFVPHATRGTNPCLSSPLNGMFYNFPNKFSRIDDIACPKHALCIQSLRAGAKFKINSAESGTDVDIAKTIRK
ncbi:MAG: hypothetical protein ABJA02_01725 [Acidobacteriota bacterium]